MSTVNRPHPPHLEISPQNSQVNLADRPDCSISLNKISTPLKPTNCPSQKRFVKGLRQFGKNFSRIRKDLLPHKDTPELVEFYYLWKKTPGANNNRPHRRRRQGSLRRIRNTRNSRAGTPKEEAPAPKESTPPNTTSAKETPNEPETPPVGASASSNTTTTNNNIAPGGEVSSVTEDDNSEEDSDSRDTNTNGSAFERSCQHCFSTTSKDYQIAGKDRLLLCLECRAHLKKTGELPPAQPYLFRPVPAESPDSPSRMRTRNKAKETPRPSRPRRNGGTDTPDQDKPDKVSNQATPDKKKKQPTAKVETPKKGQKRPQEEPDEDKDPQKRKRGSPDSPAESLTTDSNSLMDEPERENEIDTSEPTAPAAPEEPASPVDTAQPEEPAEPPPVSTPLPITVPTLPINVPVIHAIDKKPIIDEMPEVKTEPEDTISIKQPLPMKLEPIQSEPEMSPIKEEPEPDQPQALVTSQSMGISDLSQNMPRNLSQSMNNPVLMNPGLPQSLPPVSIPQAPQQMPLNMQYPTPATQNVPQNLSQNLAQSIQIPQPIPQNLPRDLIPPQNLSNHTPEVQSLPQNMSVPPLNLNIPQNLTQITQMPPSPQPLGLTLPPQDSRLDRIPDDRMPDRRLPDRMDQEQGPPEPTLFQPIQPSPLLPDKPVYSLACTPPLEPQNLKIKQEIMPPEPDPLQSLKEVKVPGYQPGFPGPSLDNIKKDPDANIKPPTPKHQHPPPQNVPQIQSVAASPTPSLHPPTSIPQPVMHPSQQPSPHMAHSFHPHHPLMHHSLFAAMHPYHPHAYPGYPPVGTYPSFPPYPYGPVPHAIPPPSPQRSQESTTMMTAHHSSTSSSVTTRDEGENLIATHHHSSSLHQATTMHHDKLLGITSHSSHSHSQSHSQHNQRSKPPMVSSCMTSTSSVHHHHRGPSGPGQQAGPPPAIEPKIEEIMEPEPEEPPSPRGPSPEPRVEDSECHRSQSAIFLRHWNRGENNSCTRTDLMFKPVPESKLARKREERSRKQAEKEREERDRAAQHARKMSTPEKQPEVCKPPSRGPMEPVVSPYDRYAARPTYADTPALRQLSEYARPHAAFSPARHQAPPDPMLHYMYGPGARERLELEHMEREKREREIRELRERELNDRLKEELMKGSPRGMPGPIDAHWMEMQRRYAAAGLAPQHGGPPQGLHQFGIYGAPPGPSQLDRERLERLGKGL